jgi:hypothetical protein
MLDRWNSTVFSLRNSEAAASRLLRPLATISAACSSCGVSDHSAPAAPFAGVSPAAASSVRARSAQ